MSRNTTHEYRCLVCGLTFKGRETARGIIASDAPPSGETRECVCNAHADERKRNASLE
jgi:hypothetical protein